MRAEREAEAQANRRRFATIAVVVLLLAAIVAIVVVMVLRRRSRELESARQQAARAEQEARQAQEEAERAQAPPPHVADCLLTGETAGGQPISVKLPGSLLLGEGAVIGRSPRNATFLIDDETLSREHARITFTPEAGLRIQDLDSTNGTRLNGRQLQPRTPANVANDDEIELGDVKLRVAWEA